MVCLAKEPVTFHLFSLPTPFSTSECGGNFGLEKWLHIPVRSAVARAPGKFLHVINRLFIEAANQMTSPKRREETLIWRSSVIISRVKE